MATSSTVRKLQTGANRGTEHRELEKLYEENEYFRESFDQMSASLLSLRAEEEGWIPINRAGQKDGFTLSALQEVAKMADLWTSTYALLSRGFDLHLSYVFGKGLSFKREEGKISAAKQAIMDKPINKNVLHTQEAHEQLERKAFSTGNVVMAYRISTKTFFPIPFQQITNHASNPDSDQDVWYYQRSWNETDLTTGAPSPDLTVKWYPVLEKFEEGKAKLRKTLNNYPVDSDVVLIVERFNRPADAVWGVPDVLPAMPYAWAHAEYVRDAGKMLKALQMIAWKVVARTKANSINAGAKISRPNQAGSTATMTEGTDLVSMPRAGSVNMKDGQTMASYIAAALRVSVVALLSDPGAAGGSFGASAALLPSEANTTRARQSRWANFYERCWRAIGLSGVIADFPKLSEDPIHRQNQSLALGFEKGAIHQDEYRAAFIEANDITPLHEDLPKPTEFTVAATKLRADIEAQDDAAQAAQDGLSAQGVSGAVGALADGDNELRDEE